jgi:glutamine amidotransferase
MIAIIDYGMGNLKSLQNSLEYLGKSSVITREEKKVNESDYIILPGVGSFNLAMKYIKNYSLDIILRNEVFIKKKTSTWNLSRHATSCRFWRRGWGS